MKWLRLLNLNSYFTAAGVAAAAGVATAAVGVAGAVKGAKTQEEAVEEQNRIQAQAAEDAQAQNDAVFAQQAEDAKTTKDATVEFGVPDDDEEVGTYDDFISPTSIGSNAGLGTSGNSAGLGFDTL